MDKQTIIDHICKTPENNNPAVLNTLLDELIESQGGGYEEVLLWENPDPTKPMPDLSKFGITRDILENYTHIKFEHKVDASDDISYTIMETKFLFKDENIGYAYCVGFMRGGNQITVPQYRLFGIDSDGELYTKSSVPTSMNTVLYKIYGVELG